MNQEFSTISWKTISVHEATIRQKKKKKKDDSEQNCKDH